MIEQRARVVGTEGGFVLVEAAPSGGCGSCGVQGGCGVSRLGKLLPRRSRVLRVPNELGARPGNEVTLGVADHALLASAAAGYLPPLVGLLAGALLAAALSPDDRVAMLGAGAGMLLGLAAARLSARRWNQRHALRMVARRPGSMVVVWHRTESDPSATSMGDP